MIRAGAVGPRVAVADPTGARRLGPSSQDRRGDRLAEGRSRIAATTVGSAAARRPLATGPICRHGHVAAASARTSSCVAPSRVTSTLPLRSVRRTSAAAGRHPVDGRLRRMAVRVARPGRRDRDPRPDRIEERTGRRRPAAVMSDLEQVDPRQAAAHEDRVDLLLDVPGQQEALAADLAEQDDRDVVDRGAAVGRFARARRPRSGHRTVNRISSRPNRSPVASRPGSQPEPSQSRLPGAVAGSGPDHPGLEGAPDPVPIEQAAPGRPRDPRGDGSGPAGRSGGPTAASRASSATRSRSGIRPAVDEEPATAPALDEDRVALSDVEHGDPDGPSGRFAAVMTTAATHAAMTTARILAGRGTRAVRGG